ncbi:MAG: CdaR family protein, partial [Oscillibacter sp.]|nr:CdaR family protein [Oscillibacter sp.]
VTKQFANIPIEFVGENTTLADRGLMLLDSSEEAVTLKLEGSRRMIAQLDPEKIRVQVDLSDVTETGKQNISTKIIYPDSKFSKNLTLISNSSYTVTVNIGELYSRDVEIRCDIQGAVADGYIAGEIQFQPGTLEIRGVETDVDTVSYAKVTLPIDNATETVTQMLDYKLYDTNNQEIDSNNIHPTIDQIQVTLPVNVVKELPLTLNFLEADGASLTNVDYTISPASITVSGDAAKLKGVESVMLDDFDLSELNGSATYNYAITVPDGCENLSGVTRATLKISFKDMTSATIEATQFETENVPEGKSVTVLTSELDVTIRGTSVDVAAVTADYLTVVADLKDVSSASGSYTVPATIRIDSGGDVGVVGTYQVKVNISDES